MGAPENKFGAPFGTTIKTGARAKDPMLIRLLVELFKLPWHYR